MPQRCLLLFTLLPFLALSAASDGIVRKERDLPNPLEVQLRRQADVRSKAAKLAGIQGVPPYLKAGNDRVLVLLVEFAGTDSFEFVPTGDKKSTWDPYGVSDTSEWAGSVGDCSNIIKARGITAPKRFTYSGPLHNRIARPDSSEDTSGTMIWAEDFSPKYYQDLSFGDGLKYSYSREDGSIAEVNLAGRSVRSYYKDASGGRYEIDGDVIGWLQVPHSVWWYGADPCPGRRSTPSGTSFQSHGAIPGAGNVGSLVTDALEAAKSEYPNLDWSQYDLNHDGVIDRLWIIHAGLGEEESPSLLSRTDYGEGGIWSMSSNLSPAYEIKPGIKAGPYIIMPENAGIAVLAHEYAHNLGADDLYAYNGGDPSPGFWTIMADDWTGNPIGSMPSMFDPMHLDWWGWLEPLVITDPTQEYTVTLGQASEFPADTGAHRGVRIDLPDGKRTHPVKPNGQSYYWSGKTNMAVGRMTQMYAATLPPDSKAALVFQMAHDLEFEWDFLHVQVSTDGARTWTTLANEHTTCTRATGWGGPDSGVPLDMCAAKVGGFSGKSREYPKLVEERFDLARFAGQYVQIRFLYVTDVTMVLAGAFLDDIRIVDGANVLFADDAESTDAKWSLAAPWAKSAGFQSYQHSYYLQWRNTSPESGGFDSALTAQGWRYAPAAGGLLVWYNNRFYTDNELTSYLRDPPSFGPKGMMLLVDAHPDPYRDPLRIYQGYANEGANAAVRSQVRDAAFSLVDYPAFNLFGVRYEGRPAVPLFSDARGYYPGAEHVSRGPGYDPPLWQWLTRQWDASAVLPSTVDYPLLAPGYSGSSEFRWRCSPNLAAWTMGCSFLGTNVGLGYDGGNGNPGDVQGQYGWNVEILEQNEATATVRIWNSRDRDLPPFVYIKSPAPGSTVSGAVSIDVQASDDSGIARAELLVDGVLRAQSEVPPFRFDWDTSGDSNGARQVVVKVWDSSGQVREDVHQVILANPEAPTVRMLNLKGGADVSGVFRVEVDATSGALLELFVDGGKAASFDGMHADWDTGQWEPGFHWVQVVARAPDGRTADCGAMVRIPAR
jgi:immune inhibitor A